MKVLLHICCGVCAAGAAERLISEGYEVKGYFYNPNIYPEDEYRKRLKAARKVAEEIGIDLVEGFCNTGDWYKATEKFKEEPEGGKRCIECFRFRLMQTYRYLDESRCDLFTTTLTISSRKPAGIINETGLEIGGDRYLVRDFKKKDGFLRASILSKEWEIYRQHYCGCEYSMKTD